MQELQHLELSHQNKFLGTTTNLMKNITLTKIIKHE